LLARAINWAMPSLSYTFENDVARVKKKEFRERLLANDGNDIFQKGLNILNSDKGLEQLISSNIAYQIYLVNKLLDPAEAQQKYPGLVRMRKFLAQSTEDEPDIEAVNFKEGYKKLFVEFNNSYGKYGKTLSSETVDSFFCFFE